MSIKLVKWYTNFEKWRPNREQWLKLMSSVAQDEREGINKFVFQEKIKEALIGRALIRHYVSSTLGIPSNELVLKRSSKGRPQLCENYRSTIDVPNVFDFNISHSGDFCILGGVCGQTDNVELTIGADIEKIGSRESQELSRFLYLMSKREFLPAEWSIVKHASTDRLKCINFARLWCLKESFIKSNGLGLAFGLSRICYNCKSQYNESDLPINRLVCDTTVEVDGHVTKDWNFIETALDDQHLVALGLNFKNLPESEVASLQRSMQSLFDPFEEVQIETLVEKLSPIDDPDVEHWFTFSNKPVRNVR